MGFREKNSLGRICVFEYCLERKRQWKVYFLQQWSDGLSEMIHREQYQHNEYVCSLYTGIGKESSIMSFSKELNDWFEKMPLATQPFESINVQDYLIEWTSYYTRIRFNCVILVNRQKVFQLFIDAIFSTYCKL